METAIKIFSNPQFGEIRTVTSESGEPLFCLTDLCRSLDLNQGDVKRRLSEGVVSTQPLKTSGGTQQANFVNEDGLYDVILDSRKPEAKAFRKWVTSEVLPSIRKTGGYIATKTEDTPELIMARAIVVANEAIERSKKAVELLESEKRMLESKNSFQETLLNEQAPRVRFSEAVETSNRSCLVAELAKVLNQNGVDIGQNRLFTWMRENGYLCKHGEYYNQPTQMAMELGLFELKKTSITKPDGTVLVTTTTKVTGKGQIYFVNKFLKSK